MINEVLEKYSKDVFGIPVWEWLGIAKVTWSVQKKNGLSKKNNQKIREYFGAMDMDDKTFLIHLVKDYIQKT